MSTTAPGAKWSFSETWSFFIDVPQDVLLEYFKALLVCCNSDGNLSETERQWCIGYCAAFGGTAETLAALRAYPAREELNEVIRRGQHYGTAHRPVIYDSIRACSSDGDYNAQERASIRKMAAEIGVTPEEVAAFEALVAEEKAFQAKRVKLVFPHGTPY